MFWDWTDLGSVKHQTKAEVDDAFKVCTDAMEEFDCGTASIPVDNAAFNDFFEHILPGRPIVATDDPG